MLRDVALIFIIILKYQMILNGKVKTDFFLRKGFKAQFEGFSLTPTLTSSVCIPSPHARQYVTLASISPSHFEFFFHIANLEFLFQFVDKV